MQWPGHFFTHLEHLFVLFITGLGTASIICSTIANFLPNPVVPHKNPDGTPGEFIHSSYPYWVFYMFINAIAMNLSKVTSMLNPHHNEGSYSNLITLFGLLVSKGGVGEKYKEAYNLLEEGEKVAPEVEQDIKDVEEIVDTVEEINKDLHHHPSSTTPPCEHCGHSQKK